MSAEDEERFQLSNKCWVSNKLFVAKDNKVRDHNHVTGKYRGSAHWSCNINLKLTKKGPVIIHLIMLEISKFDVKINFIPNGLENTWVLQ